MSCNHQRFREELTSRMHNLVLKYKQATQLFQCDLCQVQKAQLFACLDCCSFVGCGPGSSNHMLTHAQERKHFNCCSLKESKIICLNCDKELPQDRKNTRNSTNLDGRLKQKEIPMLLEEMDYLGEEFKPKGLSGLTNMGNTCYMNSALQSLSNCPPLTQFFLNCEQCIKMSENEKTTVAAEYSKLVKKIWDFQRQKYITPAALARLIRQVYPQFRGYNQQDSQEFLRCIMDKLHEELKRPVMSLPSSRIPLHKRESHFNRHSKKLLGGNNASENYSNETSVDSDYHARYNGHSNDSNDLNEHNDRDEEKGPVSYHSIIADVFNGKLTSSVQCLACQRVSTKIDNFQDLSLPIPEKDDLIRLHTQCSPHSLSCSSGLQEHGWMYSFYDWLRSWFVGPQVSLQDCLAAFFAKDELKGDNMYNCEKCNKLRNGVKYLRVLSLPEVLCIHLKRFRHEMYYSSKINSHVLFPVTGLELKNFLGKDCSSQFTTYDLCAVITHFGSVGGGHYVSYAKNCLNNKWYEFNDSLVSEVSEYEVESAEAYCLFYNKRSSGEQKFRASITEAVQSNSYLNVTDGVFLSQEWFTRFRTCVEPGHISNYDFLCRHGDVPPSTMPNIRRFVMRIPSDVWHLLQSRFGGGPEVNLLTECKICKELQKRREFESSNFSKLHDEFQKETDPDLAYCLSINWYKRWNAFTKGDEQEPPGPIDNSHILEKKENEFVLKEDSDYGLVSETTWNFLTSQYNGGPEFKIEKSQKSRTEEDGLDNNQQSNG